MKKKAISAIVKGVQKVAKASAKKKAAAAVKKVSSGAKTTAKTKNVRSKIGLDRKAVLREGFDPAKSAAAKAKGVKVTPIKKALTPAQRKANDAAAKAGKRVSANPKVAKKAAKKVAKKAAKKVAKKAAKKVAKKAPVKKVAKKAPVKKAAAKKAPTKKVAAKKVPKKTAPKGPKQGPKTAAESVKGKPLQGPSNYKGSFFKNKESALNKSKSKFMNSKGRGKAKSKSGESARQAGYRAGRASVGGKAAKKVKKGAGKVLKSRITQGVGAGYAGAKMGSRGNGGSSNPQSSKYFTEAELQAAKARVRANRNR